MSEEPKPCPFCGSNKVYTDGFETHPKAGPITGCDSCGASGPMISGGRNEDAISAWNCLAVVPEERRQLRYYLDQGMGFCPECGVTSIDEDGCCFTCGATATGRAIEELADVLAAAPNPNAS